MHVVTISLEATAETGSIIDFSFVSVRHRRPLGRRLREDRPGRPADLVGRIRTHPWGQMDDREGTGWVPDLTLIDSGWKDKQWGTEPVYILAAQAGFRGILPCKGRSPWQQRNAELRL